jgi:hypothetical protein
VIDPGDIRCSECRRAVDEFMAIKERWGYWSDGCGELLPLCPGCARREFAPDARASGSSPLVRLYAEKESPKYEKAAMRWLERYVDESSPRLEHFAEITASLAKIERD